MCDESLSMFERYRAMFALRDQGDEAAIVALASGFSDKSPVFRHEIAYIYGQLQHPAAAPFLTKVIHPKRSFEQRLISIWCVQWQVLSNETEHEMVRHEVNHCLSFSFSKRLLYLIVSKSFFATGCGGFGFNSR